ncbi:MAG: hypothetical protein JXA93_25260 [Anaerolineae bacterium]|nr:hypothetical protein [Anaerolineae bacterium]
MNKTLARWALILALSAASCAPLPAAQPEPLALPYLFHTFNYSGNETTITLSSTCDRDLHPAPYCFQVIIHTAPGQTSVGAHLITIPLTEGYQPDRDVDWAKLLRDETGVGRLWSELDPASADDLLAEIGFGLGAQADHPVAIFLRVAYTRQGASGPATIILTDPPLAVLQILPGGRGVVRLDE